MSHTPGPWRVGFWSGQCHKAEHGSNHPGLSGPNPCVYEPVFHAGNGGIAGPNPGQMVVSVTYDGLEMSEDDARPISAAPDLLAALADVTNRYEAMIKDCGGCDHSVGICWCEEIRSVDAARAALAKASP